MGIGYLSFCFGGSGVSWIGEVEVDSRCGVGFDDFFVGRGEVDFIEYGVGSGSSGILLSSSGSVDGRDSRGVWSSDGVLGVYIGGSGGAGWDLDGEGGVPRKGVGGVFGGGGSGREGDSLRGSGGELGTGGREEEDFEGIGDLRSTQV